MKFFSHKYYDLKLACLLMRLSKAGSIPKHLELVPVGDFFFANVFDEKPANVIADTVYSGFAQIPSLAILKAFVEMAEAKAFREGMALGLASCQTDRSDGFAAYPTTMVLKGTAYKYARANAYHEACERFLWANWWDHWDFGFKISSNLQDASYRLPETLVKALVTHAPIKSLKLIEPFVEEHSNVNLVILLLELEDGGFITGGAVGGPSAQSKRLAVVRAFSELYRHTLALARLKDHQSQGLGFYEQRLAYFGFGKGASLVRARLEHNGSRIQKIPECAIDEVIPHTLDDTIIVHRCLLRDQPPFVGGILERLCI